jgi:hypothetical protein
MAAGNPDLLQSEKCAVRVFPEGVYFGVARTEDALNFDR